MPQPSSWKVLPRPSGCRPSHLVLLGGSWFPTGYLWHSCRHSANWRFLSQPLPNSPGSPSKAAGLTDWILEASQCRKGKLGGGWRHMSTMNTASLLSLAGIYSLQVRASSPIFAPWGVPTPWSPVLPPTQSGDTLGALSTTDVYLCPKKVDFLTQRSFSLVLSKPLLPFLLKCK